ncbi:MAG: HAMP domain-containing histidine kinase [Bacteroidales bacterium]|nr:HAMP domain-containing histidine kinase [Bacteroidales bacterium]
MSRKSIWFLASFAAIALIALIIVQFVWINGAIEVQERQFDQLINRSINQIINKLEEYETLRYLEEELKKDTKESVRDQSSEIIDPATISGISYGLGEDEGSAFLFDDIESNRAINQIDLLSGDTMVLLPGSSLYDINRSPSHTRSFISKADLISNYEQLSVNKRVFVERVFNTMIRYEGTIESRLPRIMLDTVIQAEIDRLQLNLPYEYAVKTSQEKYSLSSRGFNYGTAEKKYVGLLYPRDLITTPNFLVIYFTGQKGYIFRSVSLMAEVSLILIFLLLILSFISTYVIFRQKKLSEIKNDFVNNMTHELKTPISTISLASQMLADSSIPNNSKNLGHISGLISEESKRLAIQVEKVLQISILDQGQMKLKYTPLDIDQLLTKVINTFSLQLKQKDAKTIVNLNSQNTSIEGDEIHLTNVFYNLLDNALKYSKEDPIIYITSKTTNKGVIIKIKDNGIGMSKDHRKKIFEKFFRVPTGNIHNIKGFGLGLSYVKKIIEEHHGTVSVESEIKKGSEFTLFLPYHIDSY